MLIRRNYKRYFTKNIIYANIDNALSTKTYIVLLV